MNFNEGQYVVYNTSGICKIAGTELKSFDGIHENEYLKLIPVCTDHSTYYVPAGTADTKLRQLLSKDEIYELIDNIPNSQMMWCIDNSVRKYTFDAIIKSGNYTDIISMLKLIYDEQQKRIADGKKLSVSDEKAMKSGESMIFGEFSVVLGIHNNEVSSFIKKRLENLN